MVLTVTDLSCTRGGIPVLEGVGFTLAPGSALMLTGPNGIGKTTLLRTLAGLQPPLRGSVSAPPDSLAYAGHADGVKSALTVRENLAFWAAVHGRRLDEAALGPLRLAPLADRLAGELSAGQRRRLGLARLLVAGRRIWLLDEPTVSLDAASVGDFAALVTAHLAAGGSALVASHVAMGLAGAAVLDLLPFRARAPVEDFEVAFG